MEKKNPKSKRKYDSQFKTEAIQQVNNGRSVPSVAKALGISEGLLYQWCKKSATPSLSTATSELEALRKAY